MRRSHVQRSYAEVMCRSIAQKSCAEVMLRSHDQKAFTEVMRRSHQQYCRLFSLSLSLLPVMAAVRERTSSRIRFSLMSSEAGLASTSLAEDGEKADSSEAATDSGVPKKSSS